MQLDLRPPSKPGWGNGLFLADLAENVPDEVMRRKFKAGEYDGLNTTYAPMWRKLAGRS